MRCELLWISLERALRLHLRELLRWKLALIGHGHRLDYGLLLLDNRVLLSSVLILAVGVPRLWRLVLLERILRLILILHIRFAVLWLATQPPLTFKDRPSLNIQSLIIKLLKSNVKNKRYLNNTSKLVKIIMILVKLFPLRIVELRTPQHPIPSPHFPHFIKLHHISFLRHPCIGISLEKGYLWNLYLLLFLQKISRFLWDRRSLLNLYLLLWKGWLILV